MQRIFNLFVVVTLLTSAEYSEATDKTQQQQAEQVSDENERLITLAYRRSVEARAAIALKQQADALALVKKTKALLALVHSHLPTSALKNLVAVGVEKTALDSPEKLKEYMPFILDRVVHFEAIENPELKKSSAKLQALISTEFTAEQARKQLEELQDNLVYGDFETKLLAKMRELDRIIGLLAQNNTKDAEKALLELDKLFLAQLAN